MKQKINIKFPTFYPKQLEIFDNVINGTSVYNTLNGGRQTGKSVLLINIALYWALTTPGAKILIVSPVDSQVKKLYEDLIKATASSNLIRKKRGSGGNAQIILHNDSELHFRSAKSGDSIRGIDPTYILADESAFMHKDVWYNAIEPAFQTNGKRIFMCSTPRGNNWFKQMYMKGLGDDDYYSSFKLTYHENPYANLEFINKRKVDLIPEIFQQEYLGEFMDSFSIFHNVRELATLAHAIPSRQRCYVGIDIAFKVDYTVVTCLDADGNMLDYIRFNGVNTEEMCNRIMQFNMKWSPERTVIEMNNQGIPVYDALISKGILNLEGFNTTPKSKNEIINKLMSDFQTKSIKLINDELVINEFNSFTYKLTSHGNITFGAEYGHDDHVMSFAFANYARGKCSYVPLLAM